MMRWFFMFILLLVMIYNVIMIATGHGSVTAWFMLIPSAAIWYVLHRAYNPTFSRRFVRKMQTRDAEASRDMWQNSYNTKTWVEK